MLKCTDSVLCLLLHVDSSHCSIFVMSLAFICMPLQTLCYSFVAYRFHSASRAVTAHAILLGFVYFAASSYTLK